MSLKSLQAVTLVMLLLFTACSAGGASAPPQANPRTLTVLAASSLIDAFGELGDIFEQKNPGVTLSFNFAGSQQLAQQLAQGADADVFASASQKYMDAAVEAKRVKAGDAVDFAGNRLVVAIPGDNPANLTSLQDLAKPGIKLDLADKAVPAGQYALDFLDKASADPAFGASYKDEVLKNVISYEDNVKAVVTKLILGEADAGIVYVTDIHQGAADERLGTLEIPNALNTTAAYPIAPVTDSKYPDLAKAFVDLVLSPEGQAVLAKYGFIPAAG
jgi:molybdate transport system substrate-binding protein